MAFRFSSRSLAALSTVQAPLQKVMNRAISESPTDFLITEGRRSKARQRALVAAGASRTMDSKHLTGAAVDVAALVDGQVRWDWPLYSKIAKVVKAAAKAEGVAITWAGDWRSFKDGPHFELAE